MRLVIAYDGSPSADIAIDDLQRAGLPDDVEACVLCVADLHPDLPAGFYEIAAPAREAGLMLRARAFAKEQLAEAATLAQNGTRRLLSLFPSWRIEPYACADSPDLAIVNQAVALKADLIVVGTSGRSAINRLILGSVSRKVLNHAPCSIRIGRRDNFRARNDPARLLIGVDSSQASTAAVEEVAKRRWPPDSHTTLLTAIDAKMSTVLAAFHGHMSTGQVLDERELISKSLEESAQRLQQSGLRVHPVVLDGDPKHLLLAEARRSNVDCIFLGATGLSGLERVFLGSVSSSVAFHAQCSVEVIRPTIRDESPGTASSAPNHEC